jgi:hypothetical protein
VPSELFAKFQTSFYSDSVDAAFKALGVLNDRRVSRTTGRDFTAARMGEIFIQ